LLGAFFKGDSEADRQDFGFQDFTRSALFRKETESAFTTKDNCVSVILVL
jgi:hypothetical protein